MLTAILALTLAQQGPPTVPGPPPVPAEPAKDYLVACFVNTPRRDVNGLHCVGAKSLNGSSEPRIVVGRPNQIGAILSINATDQELRRAAVSERQVSRAAVPFESVSNPSVSKPVPQTADDSPWLSRAESKRVEAIWPASLTFPSNLKFYKLEPRYQNLFVLNGLRTRRIEPLHHETLVHSGGMESFTGWGSVKGLDIPNGKRIVVWEEEADVRGTQNIARWRWQFPQGTVAYDVLYTKNGIFEIRTQERTKNGWSTKILHKDQEAVPSGYTGLQQSCASCHDHTAEIVAIPGTYHLVRWGDDGRFSWRPFDESGNLDARWPIERR